MVFLVFYGKIVFVNVNVKFDLIKNECNLGHQVDKYWIVDK